MGYYHEDGYSSEVEGYLVINGRRIRLAKTNGRTLLLAEPCELAPGTEGELLVIVDGKRSSRRITLPMGVVGSEKNVAYEVVAPF